MVKKGNKAKIEQKSKVQWKTNPQAKPKKNKRRNLHLHDFLEIHKDRHAEWIVEQKGGSLENGHIFCDYVTRINSHKERKMKVLLICDDYLYILNPKTAHSHYSEKLCVHLQRISSVTIPKTNKTLMKIGNRFE